MSGTAMQRSLRTVAGFLIAPLVPSLIAAVGALFTDGPSAAALFFVVGVLFGYPVALMVGVPLHLIFAIRNWTGLSAYVIAGLLLGLLSYGSSFLAAIVFGGETIAELRYTFSPGLALIAAIAGLLAAVSFWLIARPDRVLR